MKVMTSAIVGLVAAAIGSSAIAGVTCTESVRSAILHSNGNVYFLTDQTCNGAWCQIEWGTSERNKNALAMLLLAKATSKPISFYWSNLGSCSQANPVYTSPAYISME
jgi:hypothetical protein